MTKISGSLSFALVQDDANPLFDTTKKSDDMLSTADTRRYPSHTSAQPPKLSAGPSANPLWNQAASSPTKGEGANPLWETNQSGK